MPAQQRLFSPLTGKQAVSNELEVASARFLEAENAVDTDPLIVWARTKLPVYEDRIRNTDSWLEKNVCRAKLVGMVVLGLSLRAPAFAIAEHRQKVFEYLLFDEFPSEFHQERQSRGYDYTFLPPIMLQTDTAEQFAEDITELYPAA